MDAPFIIIILVWIVSFFLTMCNIILQLSSLLPLKHFQGETTCICRMPHLFSSTYFQSNFSQLLMMTRCVNRQIACDVSRLILLFVTKTPMIIGHTAMNKPSFIFSKVFSRNTNELARDLLKTSVASSHPTQTMHILCSHARWYICSMNPIKDCCLILSASLAYKCFDKTRYMDMSHGT